MISACYGLLGTVEDDDSQPSMRCHTREGCQRYQVATKALKQHDPRQHWVLADLLSVSCRNHLPVSEVQA